jgi:D-alanine-D-alanine ligase
MDERTRHVVVLFGGPTGEHEVSCASAAGMVSHLDRDRFTVQPMRITMDGEWAPGPADFPSGPVTADELVDATPTQVGDDPVPVLRQADVVLIALHGPFGEDGTVQALLEVLGVPYVGSGVAASAVGMDKDATKRVLGTQDVPVAPWVVVRDEDGVDASTRARLGLPVFVKPSRAGSSVGITRVSSWDDLAGAVATARRWDDKVLVEQAVSGREVDVAVLEHPDGTLQAGPPLEIEFGGDRPFFDYDAKYQDDGTRFLIPASLDASIIAELQRLAVRAFELLGCRGLARVDFLLRGGTEPVFNEINTLPGFTAVSQYPRIWDAAGLSMSQLLELMIDTALVTDRRPAPA